MTAFSRNLLSAKANQASESGLVAKKGGKTTVFSFCYWASPLAMSRQGPPLLQEDEDD
jgi:hypothetical protein